LRSLRERFLLHGMLNAYWEPLTFELPPAPDGVRQPWRRWIDTSLPSPDDICPWEKAPFVTGPSYAVPPRASAFIVLPLQAESRRHPATGVQGVS
jgi:glycogen operon protein